jgi:hypothetical protein
LVVGQEYVKLAIFIFTNRDRGHTVNFLSVFGWIQFDSNVHNALGWILFDSNVKCIIVDL